jgi:hypothetical protein
MSLHTIADKAEISVDFPDKAYMGSFGRHSQFDAYADVDSVAIRLVRPGEDRREAMVRLRYGLLAETLAELARSLAVAKSSARPQNSSPPRSSRTRKAEAYTMRSPPP